MFTLLKYTELKRLLDMYAVLNVLPFIFNEMYKIDYHCRCKKLFEIPTFNLNQDFI